METLEQYKNRQVLAQLKSAYTLLHSAKLEAVVQQLASIADLETAETALQAAILAVSNELAGIVPPEPEPEP